MIDPPGVGDMSLVVFGVDAGIQNDELRVAFGQFGRLDQQVGSGIVFGGQQSRPHEKDDQ